MIEWAAVTIHHTLIKRSRSLPVARVLYLLIGSALFTRATGGERGRADSV